MNVNESVWTKKPWWCQPWSILLTGVSGIAGSWLVFHRLWLTGLVALPLVAWMGFFLVIYPQAMRRIAAEENAPPPSGE